MDRRDQRRVRAGLLVGAAIGCASCALIAGLDSDPFTTAGDGLAVEGGPFASTDGATDASSPVDSSTSTAPPPPCHLDAEWSAPELVPGLDSGTLGEESAREGPDGCLYVTQYRMQGDVRIARACPGQPISLVVFADEDSGVHEPFRHLSFLNDRRVVFNAYPLIDGGNLNDASDLDILVGDLGNDGVVRNAQRFDAQNDPSDAVNHTALDDVDPFMDVDGGLTFVRALPLVAEAGPVRELRRSSGPDYRKSTVVPLRTPDGGVETAPYALLPVLAPDGFLYFAKPVRPGDPPTIHRGILTAAGVEAITRLATAEKLAISYPAGVSLNGCTLYLRARSASETADRIYAVRKPPR